jgi:hypothetical protein
MIQATRTLLPALCAVVSLGLGACGGSHSDTAASSGAVAYTSSAGSFMGDGDKDAPSSAGDGFDGDDASVRDYGHAAGAADARAITALVTRYYAAAAAGDGASACALTYALVAESLPEEYGQPPGPLYLRGASTCKAVLTIVFEHFHAQLSEPVAVTAVRVDGQRGEALLGFRALPAGVIEVRREHGAWKIDRLLALALP